MMKTPPPKAEKIRRFLQMNDFYEAEKYAGNILENLSEEDRLYLREMIESIVNEALLKNGLAGEF